MSHKNTEKMKKRVLFIDHDSGRTGSTISLGYLVQAFYECGYKVFILSPKEHFNAQPFINDGAVLLPYMNNRLITIVMHTHFMNTRNPFSWKGAILVVHEIFKFFLGIIVVWKAIWKTSPDIVYVNEHVVFQASIAASLFGIPAVIHIRSLMLDGVYGVRRRFVSRIILLFNQVVIAITKSEMEQLSPSAKERDKVNIVGEFFPRPSFLSSDPMMYRKAFGLPPDNTIVSMLGGIVEAKGSLVFLRAAEQILHKNTNVVFVLAGEFQQSGIGALAYYHDCLEVVERIKKIGEIALLGEIPRAMELVYASNIVVSPSIKTHFSRPIIEAWGMSKPVVASKTVHMQNLITHNVNGLLFEVGDPNDLAVCIEKLLDDNHLCETLGRNGAIEVKEKFDAERNLKRITDLCDKLIEAK
jgi:glycosyltransferase involved in cell wall biosynthesis